MKITRRVLIATITALFVVAVGYLKATPGVAQQTPGAVGTRVVNLYSARHYDTDNQLYESFTKKTGIKVNVVEAEADQLIERIKSEGANSPADVFITVDAGRLWRAKQAGILQPISSQVLSRAIPQNLRDPQGSWYGLSKRARVIMYNKDRVNPAQLSTYEALTDPKWKGRVLVRSSSNVYNQSLVGSLLAVHGGPNTEKWARGLVANLARPPEGNDTAQIKAVAAGVGDVAIANSYYLPRLAKTDNAAAQKIGVFFPNQRNRGTHVNISGGGVVKTAPHKQAAIQLLEHMVSREAQQIFAKSNYEYPVVSGVALDPVLASYGKFKSDNMNPAVYGEKNSEALKLMDRAGWK